MKNIYFILITILVLHAQCMDLPKRGKKRPVQEVAQADVFPLVELPKDLKIYIMTLMGEATTLSQALNDIKSLACTSTHFRDLLRDRKNVYTILEGLQTKFHKSMLEIGLKMNTSTSKEIAFELLEKSKNMHCDFFIVSARQHKSTYAYADYLVERFKDTDEWKEIPSYLFYLLENSVNRQSNLQVILKTIELNNLEQFKIWIDSGSFYIFRQEILKAVNDGKHAKFLDYLVNSKLIK